MSTIPTESRIFADRYCREARRLEAFHAGRLSPGAKIRHVDKSRYNIPTPDNPMLHRELVWYATEDDAVLGVVILDLAYKDYSWAALTQSDQAAGYMTVDAGQSLPTEEDATAALHDAMRSINGDPL
jgi:hypothetical protein